MSKQFGYQLALRIEDLLIQLSEPITAKEQAFAKKVLDDIASPQNQAVVDAIAIAVLAKKTK